MVVAQSGALRSDTFPNFRFRVAVGDDGGTERSDLVQISGWWSGVTAALPARWEKPKGGKAPAAQSRSSLSRKENTAPKNYDCDENDCAPFAPGSPTRPTGVRARFQSEAAAGVPLRRRPRRGRHQYGHRGERWQR